jgi:hypothetical protein
MKTLDELKAIAASSNGPPRGNVVQLHKREPEKNEIIPLIDHANALEEMRERENLGLKLQLYGSLLIAAKDREGLILLRKQALSIVDGIDAHFAKEAGVL